MFLAGSGNIQHPPLPDDPKALNDLTKLNPPLTWIPVTPATRKIKWIP
jgi:hypothetical protein